MDCSRGIQVGISDWHFSGLYIELLSVIVHGSEVLLNKKAVHFSDGKNCFTRRMNVVVLNLDSCESC